MQSYCYSSDSPSLSLRHFYRCIDCLSVVATETELQPVQNPPLYIRSYGSCGACCGRIEYLGQVHANTSLVKTEYRSACDSRCTAAFGPNCDCLCGGKNHGSNRVVEVIVEAGKLPRVLVPSDAKSKGETYRALLDRIRVAFNDRFGDVIERKRRGEYLDIPAWCRFQDGIRLNSRVIGARELRTHAARNRKLNAILAEIQGRVIVLGVSA